MTLASQSPPRPTGRRRFLASSGALSERPTLFRRSYYVCPNGHWSIADSDAKILPCNLCTQIAERDYEIIERRSRASRAEVGGCDPGMDVPRVGGT